MMTVDRPLVATLTARLHLFVRPEHREGFVALFRDVLRCDVRELDFGLAYPIVFVEFAGGGSFSVEFSELAPSGYGTTADDRSAFRGPWIEFRAEDPAAVERTLADAGISSFRHAGSAHTYFCAPGGQVFRVVSLTYAGP